MIADLKPGESLSIQQFGLGEERKLGCGLFLPHRGIDAVYDSTSAWQSKNCKVPCRNVASLYY